MTNQPTPAGGEKDYSKAARDFVIESLDPYFDSEQLTVIWGELEIEDLLRRSDELAQVKAENEVLRERVGKLRETLEHALCVLHALCGFTQTEREANADNWRYYTAQYDKALAETAPEEGK